MRPHEALKNRTTAEIAEIKFPYRNWQDIVAKKQLITPRQTSATSAIRISEFPRYTNSGFRTVPKRSKRLKRQNDKFKGYQYHYRELGKYHVPTTLE